MYLLNKRVGCGHIILIDWFTRRFLHFGKSFFINHNRCTKIAEGFFCILGLFCKDMTLIRILWKKVWIYDFGKVSTLAIFLQNFFNLLYSVEIILILADFLKFHHANMHIMEKSKIWVRLFLSVNNLKFGCRQDCVTWIN